MPESRMPEVRVPTPMGRRVPLHRLHVPSRREAREWLREKWHDPVAWTEVIQLAKVTVAVVGSWVLAREVFELPQPFLAPWAALLVVHSTVYRTFSRGMMQVAATVLGVFLAWAAGNLMGVDPMAIGVMTLAGLLIGEFKWLRDELTTIAATALIVLTTGVAGKEHVLVGRLLDTAIGIGVGFVVNAIMWPPLRDLSAARAIDTASTRVGRLLRRIAAELRDGCGEEQADAWVDETRQIDDEIDTAWALLRQARESSRLNPRSGVVEAQRAEVSADVLDRIEQAVAEVRSMAWSLQESILRENHWENRFRDRWTELLEAAAAAIVEPDADQLTGVRLELRDLADRMSDANLSASHWTEYGGLILNLRNVIHAMDRVVASYPVTPPSPSRSGVAVRG